MKSGGWKIVRDCGRYPSQMDDLPTIIVTNGTKEQAKNLAEELCFHYPGCDEIYKLEEGETP